MEGIWIRIVPATKRADFFSQSLYEWLYTNLRTEADGRSRKWPTTFAIAVWWGWKWRCGNVFGENKLCRDRVKFIKDRAEDVIAAFALEERRVPQIERVVRMIGWEAPRLGWMKLNTDGASRGNPGLAAAGGVVRDGDGQWCRGFAFNIGRCSAPLAELWGVYYGLVIAWEKQVARLEVEVDSELIVGILTTGICDSHPLAFLARLCYGFIAKDWIVRISHVYREANHLADRLANYAFTLPFGVQTFDDIPPDVYSVWKEDVDGLLRPRRVPV